MPVLQHIGLLAQCGESGGQGELHLLRNAAVAWRGETIAWVGGNGEIPREFAKEERIDAQGALVTPGLIDCHTHVAFAGWRADEFERRMKGESYLDIARAGGGIMSTVRKTRAASLEELTTRASAFLDEQRRLGVTTIEAKSGYGLTVEDELKLLRVYRTLSDRGPLRIVATLLAAHVVPPEFKENRDGYVRLIVDELLPIVANEKLAAFCDAFVERSAFSADEARRVLTAAKGHGLGVKLHVDQLTDGGGASLAAELGAASADHLEHVSDKGISDLARSGTVAVTLPLATLYTREKVLDARRLLAANVPVAVATDFNPGTAPSYHLPFAMLLACTMNGLTPAEALKGATIIAARSLGLEREIGSIEPGKRADLAVFGATDVNEWLYHLRPSACLFSIIGGARQSW